MHASGTTALLLVLAFMTTLAGAVMVGFGIPIKEFGIGNTLIGSGTTAIVGGLVLLGVAMAVRQLSTQLEALEARPPPRSLGAAATSGVMGRPRSYSAAAASGTTPAAAVDHEPTLDLDSASASAPPRPISPRRLAATDSVENPGEFSAKPVADDAQEGGYFNEFPHDRHHQPSSLYSQQRPSAAPEQAGAEESFASASTARPPPRTHRLNSIWPVTNSDPNLARGEQPVQARSGPAASHERSDDRELEGTPLRRRIHQIAILKSGVIDGMAYTVYTDGSIEAELPQGILRFASIDELRAYLISKEEPGHAGAAGQG
jgi:hypothetical protein